MIIKGWSVTLSLAGLGLGFSEGHFSLFALAAGTAGGFWYVETLMKRHQMRYYSRMRDIEVAAFHLNRMDLAGQQISAPKVDWWWEFDGKSGKFPSDKPERRSPAEVRHDLFWAPLFAWVAFPHVIAVVLGVVLFALAAAG